MDRAGSIPPAAFDRRNIPSEASESWWQARDGQKIRRIDWPEPGSRRGSLLFLPGRADFYEKYLETLAGWHGEGWQVTSIDWRGQGPSGQAVPGGQAGHIRDFADWVGDLSDFWSEWKGGRPEPQVIVAHSMGAHIALRALAEKRISPEALVLVAPMLGLKPAVLPLPVLHAIARVAVRVAPPIRAAWRGSERPAALLGDRSKLLTHDTERYADEAWWREARPELAMAAPSWGWIERALASMCELRRPGLLEAVTAPVLLLAVRHDGLVDFGAIREAAGRMPNAELVAYGTEARHEILREVDPVREKVLARIREFLDRAAPAIGDAA